MCCQLRATAHFRECWCMSMQERCNVDQKGNTRETRRKTCYSATSPTTNFTVSPRIEPDALQSEVPNCLSLPVLITQIPLKFKLTHSYIAQKFTSWTENCNVVANANVHWPNGVLIHLWPTGFITQNRVMPLLHNSTGSQNECLNFTGEFTQNHIVAWSPHAEAPKIQKPHETRLHNSSEWCFPPLPLRSAPYVARLYGNHWIAQQ
jgi:hypothetical protein